MSEKINDPKPPYNLDAERVILGCCLLERPALVTVMSLVQPDDLFHPPHRYIFDAAQDLFNRNISVDMVTITNALISSGNLDKAGGGDYIAGLTNVVPSVRNAEHYAGIVVETSQQRRIINLSNRIVRLMESKTRSSSRDALNEMLSGMLDIERRKAGERATEFYAGALEAQIDTQRATEGGNQVFLRTGFERLDRIISLMPGNVMVIAGITSQGKTALAGNIAANIARTGTGVLFVSAEMTPREMIWRFQSYVTTVPIKHFKFGHYYRSAARDQQDKDRAKMQAIRDRLWIRYMPGADEIDLMRAIKVEMLMHPGIGLVVIDYLQRLQYSLGRTKYIPPTPTVSIISGFIKRMAGEIKVPVIMLSQLARSDKNPAKAPTLDRLKQSGDIENDADAVLMLHLKTSIVNDGHLREPEWSMDALVLKNRNGPTGKVPMIFHRATTTFREGSEPTIPNGEPE